jgi:uncharacterized protein YhdP
MQNSLPIVASAPSRALRLWHRLVTLALALVVLLWLIIIGMTVALKFWVAPNIDSLRPRIESFATQQMQLPVRIGSIRTLPSDSLLGLPSFELAQVRVLSAGDALANAPEPLLELARVTVSVSPMSLLQLKVEQLSLDALHLQVLRDKTGAWAIAGIASKPSQEPSTALNWLLSQKEIVLTHSRIDVLDDYLKQPRLSLQDAQLVLRSGMSSHHIRIDAVPPTGWGNSIQLMGQFRQPLLVKHKTDWSSWSGNLYASVIRPNPDKFKTYLPASMGPKLAPYLPWLAQTEQIEAWGQLERGQLTSMDALAVNIPHLASRVRVHVKDLNAAAGIQIRADADLAHVHAAGKVNATWQQGKLSVQADIQQFDLTQLHHYVPATAPEAARQFWQSAFKQGTARNVRANFSALVKKNASSDTSLLSAPDTVFDVIGTLHDADFVLDRTGAWPALEKSQAAFDLKSSPAGLQLDITRIDTHFAGLATKGNVRIADLRKPVVDVHVEAKAPAMTWLSALKATPYKTQMPPQLAQLEADGLLGMQLTLQLPLNDLTQSHVTGIVTADALAAKLHPAAPPLSSLKGHIRFTDKEMSTTRITGKLLGGDFALAGQLGRAQPITLNVQGALRIEELAAWLRSNPALAASQPQLVAQTQAQIQALVARLKGQTSYKLQANAPANSANTLRALQVQLDTDLVGLASELPAPLAKAADTAWPLRWSLAGDTMQLQISDFLNYDKQASNGQLYARMQEIDLDAWRNMWSKAVPPVASNATPLPPTPPPATLTLSPTLPVTILALEAKQVVVASRRFDHVVLGASHMGGAWRVNAQAQDFDGYFEYRPGQLMARLAHVRIPDSTSKAQVEQLLTDRIDSLPALDVVIDSFELAGKKLGRLDIQAANQRATSSLTSRSKQEWRLQKLWLTNPDASFKAAGVWDGERVDLQSLNVDINDSGDLLQRLGMPNVIKNGKGTLVGRVGWRGTPLSPHYTSMAGQLKLTMDKGQFLKIDPGAGRLLSVLSLQALPRRLSLDFRDVFSEGFAFDSVAGDAFIAGGIISTNNLQMKSLLAAVQIEGTADIAKETQDLRALVLPDINAGGVSLLAAILNPVVGAVTYLSQWLLGKPLSAAATKSYRIEGSWADPKVTQIKP